MYPRCKHGKVDPSSAMGYETHNIFGRRRKSSSEMLFKLEFFSMMSSIFVLTTQL